MKFILSVIIISSTVVGFDSSYFFNYSSYNANVQTIRNSKFNNDTSKYALLYIYRQRRFEYSLASYEIHLGDSVVGRIKNSSKFIVKLYTEGPISVWAKTEKKSSVNIDVKFGKEYFLKCGYTTGIIANRPDLSLTYPEQGHLDFDNIKVKD